MARFGVSFYLSIFISFDIYIYIKKIHFFIYLYFYPALAFSCIHGKHYHNILLIMAVKIYQL